MKPLFSNTPSNIQTIQVPTDYWGIAHTNLLATLKATENGLAQQEAEKRLKQYGLNALEKRRQATALILFLSQFKSPLVLVLILQQSSLLL